MLTYNTMNTVTSADIDRTLHTERKVTCNSLASHVLISLNSQQEPRTLSYMGEVVEMSVSEPVPMTAMKM